MIVRVIGRTPVPLTQTNANRVCREEPGADLGQLRRELAEARAEIQYLCNAFSTNEPSTTRDSGIKREREILRRVWQQIAREQWESQPRRSMLHRLYLLLATLSFPP
jgi:hypothetical protein